MNPHTVEAPGRIESGDGQPVCASLSLKDWGGCTLSMCTRMNAPARFTALWPSCLHFPSELPVLEPNPSCKLLRSISRHRYLQNHLQVQYLCKAGPRMLIHLFHLSQSKLSQEQLNQLQRDTHFDKKELQQWYKGGLRLLLLSNSVDV